MEHYHGSEDILDEHREFSMPTDLIAKLKGVGHSLYHFLGLPGENGEEIWAFVGADFGPLSSYSFIARHALPLWELSSGK